MDTERDRCVKITIPVWKLQNPNMNPGSTLRSGGTAAIWGKGESQHFAVRRNRSNPRNRPTAAFCSEGQPQHFGRSAAVALPANCSIVPAKMLRSLGPEFWALRSQMAETYGKSNCSVSAEMLRLALWAKCCGWPVPRVAAVPPGCDMLRFALSSDCCGWSWLQNAAVRPFLGLLRLVLAAKCCGSPPLQNAAVGPDFKVLPGFMFGFWGFRSGMVILAHLSLSVFIGFFNSYHACIWMFEFLPLFVCVGASAALLFGRCSSIRLVCSCCQFPRFGLISWVWIFEFLPANGLHWRVHQFSC